jgi:tetratricopeptide (TPR) repeat protein
MAIMLLTIIFFAGGLIAILYSVLALLSMLKYSQAQKALPEKFKPEAGKPAKIGPPIVDAYCQRARILLKSRRFAAALADCKKAIDINPQHAEANFLWKHAQEKEIPPALLAEPKAEAAPLPAEAEPVVTEVKKVVKRARPIRRVVAEPVPAEKPEEAPGEEAAVILEEAEPEKEIILEEIAPAAAPPAAEPSSVEPEKVSVAPEPVAEEAPIAPEPDFELALEELKPEIEMAAEAEVEPVAEPEIAEKAAEEVPAVEVSAQEAPPVDLEAEPVMQLEAEAELEPAAEPETTEEVAEEVPVARKPLPGEEEGPLIPEDKLAEPKPSRESLLEEFDHEKLREYEEGEAEAGDTEWTRFADKKEVGLAESKIDMNQLPASATGLKETLTDLRQAEAYNLQGETKSGKKQYSNAIKDFSRALEIHPNYVDALINRGSAYAQLGRFNDALMDLNHALKFEKKDAELYNKRGEIYLQNEMHDQAIKDFTAAVVLNPMFSDAYLNRGRAYSEKGMPEEAMNDFNQAIKADSDHAFDFVDRAAPAAVQIDEESAANVEEAAKFLQQGLADLKSEKYEAAVENFSQALNLAGSEAESYINRGRAYIQLEKPDEAMADFKQAVLFDPLNASLYYWRAQAWKIKNDQFNMTEDLKLSCEMGYEPACLEYKKHKPTKK